MSDDLSELIWSEERDDFLEALLDAQHTPVASRESSLATLPRPPRRLPPAREVGTLLQNLNQRIQAIHSPEVTVDVQNTRSVPSVGDNSLTFASERNDAIRCKRFESCVLFVDIRNSTDISVRNEPEVLARLYSTFVNSIVDAAEFFGGKVRNVIGDRVMVVFDRQDCFRNAVDTAALFNTICNHMIEHSWRGFRCGIGIDFGEMLVNKVGEVRRGDDRELYRSLAWLGEPANKASKLTDIAATLDYTSALPQGGTPTLLPPILISPQVLKGLRDEASFSPSVLGSWWKQFNTALGTAYGADFGYVAVNNILNQRIFG